MAKQSQLILKADSADFQFDTTETGCHFLLYPGEHRVKVAHPDKPVYRNPRLSLREVRIVQCPTARQEMTERRFQSEQDGRIVAQDIRIQFSPALFQPPASPGKYILVIGKVVTTQCRQRSALSYSRPARIVGRGQMKIPHFPGRIHPAGSPRRLLEMQQPGDNLYLAVHYGCQGNLGYCLKLGLRFSRNAFLPSWASSVR